MWYFIPKEEGLTYRFEPRIQYAVEQLLVEHWDSIFAMIVAQHNGGAVEFEPFVRDAVLEPFADLLDKIDPARRCRQSPADFAAAVRWLLETKEFPTLRLHVLGEPVTTVNGPMYRLREGLAPFQLATALPNGARGWWYSAETMAGEFRRYGADDATAADVAILFNPEEVAERTARQMRLRKAHGAQYVWISSSLKTTFNAHGLVDQLAGRVDRPENYVATDSESFRRSTLKVWRDWKTRAVEAAAAASAPGAAPLVSRRDASVSLLNAIASLVVASWHRMPRDEQPDLLDVVFAVFENGSDVERLARFDLDDIVGSVRLTVVIGGRRVPDDNEQLAKFKVIATVDDARLALQAATPEVLVKCPGFDESALMANPRGSGSNEARLHCRRQSGHAVQGNHAPWRSTSGGAEHRRAPRQGQEKVPRDDRGRRRRPRRG